MIYDFIVSKITRRMNYQNQIFDTLMDAVFVIDANQQIIYLNDTAGNLLQVAPQNLIRKAAKFGELFSFSQPVRALANLHVITEPTSYQEVNFSTQLGTLGALQITVQRPDSKIDNWVIFARETTMEQSLHEKFKAELFEKEKLFNDLQIAHQSLERHSRDLELTVEQRTVQLSKLNQLNQAMLDSLDQGFLIFDENGLCLDIWSKACIRTVESMPAGKYIWDVLKLTQEKTESFKQWIQLVFSEFFQFESTVNLAPARFEHSQKKTITLNYYPICDSQDEILYIILVSTDISDLIVAKEKAHQEELQVQKILHLVKHKREFFGLNNDILNQFSFLEGEVKKAHPDLTSICRSLHNLKGATANFHLVVFSSKCHELESHLATVSEIFTPAGKSRILAAIWDIKMSYQEFLNENEYILGDISSQKGRKIEITYPALLELLECVNDEETKVHLTNELLTEPIDVLFEPFHDLVDDLAAKLGKKIFPLEITGGHLRVLPERLDAFVRTLVHAVRNSADHGLEYPDERKKRGKNEYGKISIHADIISRENQSWLKIKIADDGRGINPDRISEKLSELGLQKYISSDSDKLIQAVFLPAFSTKAEVSKLSGRGIGLNSIQVEVEKLAGNVWAESEVNVGSAICIEIPLEKFE